MMGGARKHILQTLLRENPVRGPREQWGAFDRDPTLILLVAPHKSENNMQAI
jgi:hypothetical protein